MKEKFDLVRFDGKDFYLWKFQMKVFLLGKELWDVVSGETAKPAADHADLPAWTTKDRKGMMYLTQALARQQLAYVVNCDTSKDVWDRLSSIHEQKSKTSVHMVMAQFFEFKKDPKDDCATHISKIESLARRLKDMGAEQSESAIMTKILCSLPSSFRGLVSAWDSVPENEQTLANLTSRLLKEEELGKKMQSMDLEEKVEVFVAQGGRRSSTGQRNQGKKKFTGECHFCNRKGHMQQDCWQKHPEKRPSKFQKGAAHIGDASEADALMAHTSAGKEGAWIGDSGATDHMTSQRNLFCDFEPIPLGTYPVRAANGSVMYCTGVGTIDLLGHDGKKWKPLSLKSVLFVPDLGRNLFSIRAATKQGAAVVMNETGCKVYKNERLMVTGAVCGNLFHMKFRETGGTEANISESDFTSHLRRWHERLGHINFATIRKAIKVGGKDAFPEPADKDVCRGCALGKMHREPFPSGPKKRESVPGAVVHADLCGKMSPSSVEGNNYFLLLKDDASNFMFIYFVKQKSEVLGKISEFLLDWRHRSPHPVCELKTDCGGEFLSKEGEKWLHQKQIRHQLSVPFCPEMNGFVERANRTVLESAKSMIHGSNVNPKLWAEACRTAVYILNRMPNDALEGKSPFEMLTGKVPDLHHVRIFGSAVFVHVPAQLRTKFQPNSKMMILVGYHDDVNGVYRVYDKESKSLKTVRHVTIDENTQTQVKQLHDAHPQTRSDDREIACSFHIPSLSDQQITYAEIHHQDEVNADDGGTNNQGAAAEHDQPEEDDVTLVAEDSGSEGDQPVIPPAPELRSLRSRQDLRSRQWDGACGSLIPGSGSTSAAHLSAGGEGNGEAEEEEGHFAFTSAGDPSTFQEAILSSSRANWQAAMNAELKALKEMGTWILVPRPKDRSVVQNRWVFRTKYRANGQVDKHKARLVAKGYSQKQGIDFEETFSPVVRFDTVRFLFALIESEKMATKQVDVVGAYLYGDLEEEIFMEEPEGFRSKTDGSVVCKLQKSLYGLRQSARQWNKKFKEVLALLGLKATTSDPCLYTTQDHDLIFALYVDDGLLAAKDSRKLDRAITLLKNHFKVTVSPAEFFVGIQIERTEKGILLHQHAYVNKILQKFQMQICKPADTPADASIKLKKEDTNNEKNLPYRELVGSLMFLVVCTRPDVAYAVSVLAQFLDCFAQSHWNAAKRVLRYLSKTQKMGITFGGGEMNLIGYSDADFAGDEDTRRSRTGTIFILNGGPVTWLSQKQSYITTSTCQAECGAAFAATKQIIWLRRLLADIGIKKYGATVLHMDNTGAIAFTSNPEANHNRTKHWDIQFKFIHEQKVEGTIETVFVPSNKQLADMLTKALPAALFNDALRQLNMII